MPTYYVAYCVDACVLDRIYFGADLDGARHHLAAYGATLLKGYAVHLIEERPEGVCILDSVKR